MSDYPYEIHLVLRLLLAVFCGAVLGYERERHGRSAGLRTNILVCTGAAWADYCGDTMVQRRRRYGVRSGDDYIAAFLYDDWSGVIDDFEKS